MLFEKFKSKSCELKLVLYQHFIVCKDAKIEELNSYFSSIEIVLKFPNNIYIQIKNQFIFDPLLGSVSTFVSFMNEDGIKDKVYQLTYRGLYGVSMTLDQTNARIGFSKNFSMKI